ncbi:DUF3306 domain-containing protein [Ruegeria arenilitoris]|uniref:DUF3306 domain-containing protein n=1 Tax=Ruegeria arenilitoris TaxID=1173585 RepID=UPI00147FFEF8|nr:DUF3306 domain-containing protein [Ruegeria arenilitoris]
MSENRDFWSRRKAAVQAEAEAETAAVEAQELAARHSELEEKSDQEILAEFNLPDPDALEPGDDVSGFMSKAVPDRLRQRALRRLWRLNPVLANVDGLVEYGEDYTDAACVIENLQTAYRVGKGMLAHIEALAVSEEEETDEPVEELSDQPPPSEPIDEPLQPPVQMVELGETESDADLPPSPRRMIFEFEG